MPLMATPRASRTIGALLGVHCGDSLGASLEFEPWSQIILRYPHGLRDIVGGGPFDWPAGHATDDTDLTRAVLLAYRDREEQKHAERPQPLQQIKVVEATAEYALNWYEGNWPGRKKGMPPVDIGNATRLALEHFKVFKDTDKSGAGIGSAGNGSLMRCIPTGLFAPEESRQTESIAISKFTHNDPRCTVACAAYNEIVAALIDGREPQEAVQIGKAAADGLKCKKVTDAIQKGETISLARLASDGPQSNESVSTSGYVLNGLTLSVAALLDTRSFEDVLVDVVRIGGDSDTNGAIAGGLLGAREGIEKIPDRWLKKLQFRQEFEDVAVRILQLQHRAESVD
jgi:ADP-ribosylglycohydrolase